MLTTSRGLRPRWLTADGTFSSDPALALRLLNPEVVAHRLQTFMELHGWGPEAMERFRLVPIPARPPVSLSAGVKLIPLRTERHAPSPPQWRRLASLGKA